MGGVNTGAPPDGAGYVVTGFVMGCAPGTVTGGATGLVSGTGELAGTVNGVVKGMDTGVAAGLDGVIVTGLVEGTVMIVGVEVSGVVGKFVVASCIVVRPNSMNFHFNCKEVFSSTPKCDPPNLPAKMEEAEAFRNRKETKPPKQKMPLSGNKKMQSLDLEAVTRRKQDTIRAENDKLS